MATLWTLLVLKDPTAYSIETYTQVERPTRIIIPAVRNGFLSWSHVLKRDHSQVTQTWMDFELHIVSVSYEHALVLFCLG